MYTDWQFRQHACFFNLFKFYSTPIYLPLILHICLNYFLSVFVWHIHNKYIINKRVKIITGQSKQWLVSNGQIYSRPEKKSYYFGLAAALV